jgi:hypothetical protein
LNPLPNSGRRTGHAGHEIRTREKEGEHRILVGNPNVTRSLRRLLGGGVFLTMLSIARLYGIEW